MIYFFKTVVTYVILKSKITAIALYIRGQDCTAEYRLNRSPNNVGPASNFKFDFEWKVLDFVGSQFVIFCHIS